MVFIVKYIKDTQEENFMSKQFDIQYKKSQQCVLDDFSKLDVILTNLLQKNSTHLDCELSQYLFSSSKRIRSTLIFLFARAVTNNVSERQYNIAASIELIHNATLIHDDIIDNSEFRRGRKTLHNTFTNKLAVIAGDFLFSLGFQNLIENDNSENMKVYTETFKTLCKGEIEQFFNNGKITDIDDYIEKSAYKTATLFSAGLNSAFSDCENLVIKNAIKEFAYNFGIAFQIRNDLADVFETNSETKFTDDIKNGIYTAPIIFAYEENPYILNSNEILKDIKITSALDKSIKLLQKYIDLSVDKLSCIEDNIYKQSIIQICLGLGDF